MTKAKSYVKCQITNSEGSILLLKRSKEDTLGGIWESVGGGVDKGESPQQAILREVLEESGLNVIPKFKGKFTFNDCKSGNPYRVHLFNAKIESEVINLENNPDHEDFVWLNGDNINAFLAAGNKIDSWTLTHTLMKDRKSVV